MSMSSGICREGAYKEVFIIPLVTSTRRMQFQSVLSCKGVSGLVGTA